MPTAIITIGLPASGKSTWARKYAIGHGYKILERGVIRAGVYQNFPAYKPTRAGEQETTDLWMAQAQEIVNSGANVINSDTNMNPATRQSTIDFFEAAGYTVNLKHFTDVAYKTLLMRNAVRPGGVPESVFKMMVTKDPDVVPWGRKQFNIPEKVYQPNGRQKCVIVDLDGTIADMRGIRKPFEFGRVGEDLPHQDVIDLIKSFVKPGWAIVCLSGRTDDDGCRNKTIEWLNKHNFPFDRLWMREAGDVRKDSMFKEDMFWKHVAPRYDPVAVFDDRRQVVELWKNMGLRVFQMHLPLTDDDF